jgi:hypothetical protein
LTGLVPHYSRARVITVLFALITAAALALSLAAPALGATTRIARCAGANLRAHPTTSAKNKIRMHAGTRVKVTGTVKGGHWHTYCGKGSHVGNTWFKITSINGKSVRKRFGVPYLYGATWLYKPKPTTRTAPPKPVPTASCTRRVGADKTGATDVTSELQRFIDASPGGSVICLASGGQYKVNGTLHIANRSHLTIEGQGATIFQTSRSTTRIWLIDGSSNDINLRHMTVKGANPSPGTWSATYEHNHGVEIGGAVNIDLGAIRVVNVGGDGLYIGAGSANGSIRWADTIDLHDSTIDGTGRSGISIADGGSNVHVDRNVFRHIAFYTLNIEPNGQVYNGQPAGARNVRFSNNTLGAQPYGTGIGDQPVGHVFVVTGSSGGGPADGITVSNNTIAGRPFDVGVYNNGGVRRNIVVSNNRSDTSAAGPVMNFSGVATLTVTGNVQPLDGSTLVSAPGCTDVTISGNVTP